MFPSSFNASPVGAAPAVFSLYHQLQYLNRAHPDPHPQGYPLTLPLYPLNSSSLHPNSFVVMAAPDRKTSNNALVSASSQALVTSSDPASRVFPLQWAQAQAQELTQPQAPNTSSSLATASAQTPREGSWSDSEDNEDLPVKEEEVEEEEEEDEAGEAEEEEEKQSSPTPRDTPSTSSSNLLMPSVTAALQPVIKTENDLFFGSNLKAESFASGAVSAETAHTPPRPHTSSSTAVLSPSAVKFSIDSILGLTTTTTKTTNPQTLTTKSSNHSGRESSSPDNRIHHAKSYSFCSDVVGAGHTGFGLGRHWQDRHRLLENGGGAGHDVKGDAVTYPDHDDDERKDAGDDAPSGRGGGHSESGMMTEEQNNFPWLQCTRYHPPKLQRSKKKEGGGTGGGGKKRKLGRNPRVPFTQHQVAVLEEKFRRTHYLSSMDVVELSTALSLSETRVKIWFQNRRARERREREASQRAQLLTQKTYQPLSIPSVTWSLTSQLASASPFSAAQYRNDVNFRTGLFSSAFSAFSTPIRHEVVAETTSPSACSWVDKHNSDEDNFY